MRNLAKLAPIVEMGAGSGYWTAMLKEKVAAAMTPTLTLALLDGPKLNRKVGARALTLALGLALAPTWP